MSEHVRERSDGDPPAPLLSTRLLSTRLTELLGVTHPIVLAPMDGAAGGRLAAAVSSAGAYGQIGGGYCDVEYLTSEIEAAEGARVGIGFITFALDQHPEALDIALSISPPAIQLSFGDPAPYADRIHESGALLICGVQAPHEVDRALSAGADLLIAQGRDAGGHGRPDLATMALIPSVVDRAGDVPVVAAGGIADGRGLAAALMLGAAGVTMGTRFLASAEAISNPAEAAALVSHGSFDTVRTDVYDKVRGPAWPDGHDGRVVRNSFTNSWDAEPVASRELIDSMHADYIASEADDYAIRPLWAGEGLDLISAIDSARDIIEHTMMQTVAQLSQASELLA